MIQVDPTGDAAAGPTAPVQVSPPTAPISVWLIPADERLNPRRAAPQTRRPATLTRTIDFSVTIRCPHTYILPSDDSERKARARHPSGKKGRQHTTPFLVTT
jgi:hypothetical protein